MQNRVLTFHEFDAKYSNTDSSAGNTEDDIKQLAVVADAFNKPFIDQADTSTAHIHRQKPAVTTIQPASSGESNITDDEETQTFTFDDDEVPVPEVTPTETEEETEEDEDEETNNASNKTKSTATSKGSVDLDI